MGERSFLPLVFLAMMAFLPLIFVSPFVSAQGGYFGDQLRFALQDAVRIATPVFEIIIGQFGSSEFFYAKVLILILIFFIVYVVLERIPAFKDQTAVRVIIGIVVSILAVRFMSENQVFRGVLLPYGTLGIVLASGIPLAIFSLVMYISDFGSVGRRLGWTLYGVTFSVLFFSRYNELDVLSRRVYLFCIIAIILFLIFDKRVKQYFSALDRNRFLVEANQNQIAHLQADYLSILHVNSTHAEATRKRIREEIKRLGGELPN